MLEGVLEVALEGYHQGEIKFTDEVKDQLKIYLPTHD